MPVYTAWLIIKADITIMFVSTWRLREYMRIWSFKETSLLRPSFVQQVSEQLNFSVLSTSQGHLWTSPTGRQDRNENVNQRSSIKVGIGDLVHCQKKKIVFEIPYNLNNCF